MTIEKTVKVALSWVLRLAWISAFSWVYPELELQLTCYFDLWFAVGVICWVALSWSFQLRSPWVAAFIWGHPKLVFTGEDQPKSIFQLGSSPVGVFRWGHPELVSVVGISLSVPLCVVVGVGSSWDFQLGLYWVFCLLWLLWIGVFSRGNPQLIMCQLVSPWVLRGSF